MVIIYYLQDKTDRYPIAIFIEKPSKKLYPDYYSVIKEPIDMRTIEANVRNDKVSMGTNQVSLWDYGLFVTLWAHTLNLNGALW